MQRVYGFESRRLGVQQLPPERQSLPLSVYVTCILRAVIVTAVFIFFLRTWTIGVVACMVLWCIWDIVEPTISLYRKKGPRYFNAFSATPFTRRHKASWIVVERLFPIMYLGMRANMRGHQRLLIIPFVCAMATPFFPPASLCALVFLAMMRKGYATDMPYYKIYCKTWTFAVEIVEMWLDQQKEQVSVPNRRRIIGPGGEPILIDSEFRRIDK